MVAALAVVAAVAVRPAVVEVAAAHQARIERMVAHRAARIEQTASERIRRPLPAVRAKCSTAPLHVAVAKRGLRRNSMGIDAQAEFDSLL